MKILNFNYQFECVIDEIGSGLKANLEDSGTKCTDGNEKLELELIYDVKRIDDDNNEFGIFFIKILNFKDFQNRDFVAFGNVHLNCESEEEDDVFVRVDLEKIQLLENRITLWNFDEVDSECSKVTAYVNVTLISEDPASNISKMQLDFGNVLQNEKYSDLVFVVGEREFKVHRNVVAARSTVFQRMLETEMKEKSDGKVEIEDVKCDVFEVMLKFMYTGTLKDVRKQEFFEDLYVAAEKYDVSDLKMAVAERLCGSIRVDNVLKRLVLAEQFEEMGLRKMCLEFIKVHNENLIEHGITLFK